MVTKSFITLGPEHNESGNSLETLQVNHHLIHETLQTAVFLKLPIIH